MTDTATRNDAEWMRRYPGSWRGPFSIARRCFICGAAGYTVPAPPTPLTVADIEEKPLKPPSIRTGNTCAGHEYAVRRALFEHPEFERLEYGS